MHKVPAVETINCPIKVRQEASGVGQIGIVKCSGRKAGIRESG
jgi:hypothetical protein